MTARLFEALISNVALGRIMTRVCYPSIRGGKEGKCKGSGVTCDWLLGEEVILHRFHGHHGERALQCFGSVLKDEPPWERRIVLFDGLNLMPDAASDVDKHHGLRIVIVEAIGNTLGEGEEVEPAIAALALSGHPEHKSFVVDWVFGEPFEDGLGGVVARLERTVGAVRRVLVFGFLEEGGEGGPSRVHGDHVVNEACGQGRDGQSLGELVGGEETGSDFFDGGDGSEEAKDTLE